MDSKGKYAVSGITGLLFIVMIILVKKYDVAAIGPAGTEVGFSKINGFFMNILPYNDLWYNVTKYLGILAILTVACFGIIGLTQLVKRKKLFDVDTELLLLGGLYVVMGALYVFFEKIVINYRPVIMEGETSPEASFPSSHTMLICVVMGSAIILFRRYVKDKKLRLVLTIVAEVIIVITVLGRLISGVHWFTDIIGGILISICLVELYAGMFEKIKETRENI